MTVDKLTAEEKKENKQKANRKYYLKNKSKKTFCKCCKKTVKNFYEHKLSVMHSVFEKMEFYKNKSKNKKK